MASILKVDTIQDQSGNNIINESADTITIGASGDTIAIPTGATLTVPNGKITGQNYPAFEAYLSATQNVTDATVTKVQIDTEVFDTDGCYDNATNYRFTPNVAGKYYVYGSIRFAVNALAQEYFFHYFYKNGSMLRRLSFNLQDNVATVVNSQIDAIVDFNGTTDYIEMYGNLAVSSGTPTFSTDVQSTYFGAYRIGA